jgi:zinc D-Ala-D-Ala dipeptidase
MTIYKALFVFLLTFNQIKAQNVNQHGLLVITSKRFYKKQCKINPQLKMVNLKTFLPNAVFDLRYATTNNFMHQSFYPPKQSAFVRLPIAKALQAVQAELQLQNKSLKFFDAYRPYAVTQKMWLQIQDERYVANPKFGSGHNKGIAVDITIVDNTTQPPTELDMGTNFDNFSDTAHHTFTNLSAKIIENRLLLKTLMQKHGFKALQTEWWHYSWLKPEGFDVLDLIFK